MHRRIFADEKLRTPPRIRKNADGQEDRDDGSRVLIDLTSGICGRRAAVHARSRPAIPSARGNSKHHVVIFLRPSSVASRRPRYILLNAVVLPERVQRGDQPGGNRWALMAGAAPAGSAGLRIGGIGRSRGRQPVQRERAPRRVVARRGEPAQAAPRRAGRLVLRVVGAAHRPGAAGRAMVGNWHSALVQRVARTMGRGRRLAAVGRADCRNRGAGAAGRTEVVRTVTIWRGWTSGC